MMIFCTLEVPSTILERLGVPIQPFGWILGGESVGPENLHALVRGVHRRLRRLQLGNGRLVMVWLPIVLEPRGLVDKHLGRLMFHRHLGDLGLDHLVVRNRLAELGPFVRVIDGQLERRAAHAQRARRAAQPGVVELPHADLEAVPHRAEQCVLGQLRSVEGELAGRGAVETQLRIDVRGHEVVDPLRFQDERAHAPVPFLRVGHDVEQPGVTLHGVRHPDLAAPQLPAVAHVAGDGLHAGDIRAALRLGHAEEADLGSRHPPRNELLLLRLGTEFRNGQRRTQVLHVEREPPRRRHLRDLLRHQDRFHEPEAGPTQFLGYAARKKAQLAHPGDTIETELVVLLFLHERGRDVVVRELPGRLLHQPLFVGQLENHSILS